MSLKDFWANVRYGARGYSPGRDIADVPRLSAEALDEAPARSEDWMSLLTVKGFDEADFNFLPTGEREALTKAVTAFRDVTRRVDPRRPATPEAVAEATPLFRSIVEHLELDRPADAEAFRVGRTIEADARFPRDVVLDARYRTKRGINDNPILKMKAYLPESDEREFLERAEGVRKCIHAIVQELADPYFAVVSARYMSDLVEVQKVGADR